MASSMRECFRARGARRAMAALMIIMAVLAALAGWRGLRRAAAEAYYPAVPVMRLHVVPHDNSAEAQALKLHVRDRLLGVILDWTDGLGLDEAKTLLLADTAALTAVAQDEVRRRGSVHRVSVLSEESADGEVIALKFVIGAGAGDNWFCVLVPPLCFADLDAVEQQPVDAERSEGGVRFAWRWLGDLFDRLSLPVERLGQVDQNDVDADLAHAPPWNGDVGPTPE